jgi:tetratricopeptide (TPR) repeat protein
VLRVQAGQAEPPLWSLPSEPHLASVGYVLAAARPHLGDGEPWMWETLAARARMGEATPDEIHLLAWALHERFGAERPAEPILQITEALLAAPEIPEPLRGRAANRHALARLMRGWELLKARELEGARAIADERLEATPDDGQVLFFEARLRWLEESIEAALARVEEVLPRVPRPGLPRARLLNLYGCGLDELGRPDEAIPWFEKAARAEPGEPMYLANLAECWEKAGDLDQARAYAEQAWDAGSRSELVTRLVEGSRQARGMEPRTT